MSRPGAGLGSLASHVWERVVEHENAGSQRLYPMPSTSLLGVTLALARRVR